MYQVGSFCFDIRNPHHVPVPDNLKRFETEQGTPEHLYRLTLVNHVEVKESEFMLNKDNMKVYVDEHVHKRYLFLKGDSKPYALCQKPIEHNATLVYVDAHYLPLFPADTIFGSILSLEKRMYFHNSFILHSAYICVNGKAVLFTAPSGGGKSTQAKLWADHRGARTINGDRTLLCKEDGVYQACGWPICGSSQICYNEQYPLACIVVVVKGKENEVIELDYKQRVKKLISELTINYHYADFVNAAMDFIDDLAKSIKIYQLTCDISEDAVRCLEERMRQDRLIEKREDQ